MRIVESQTTLSNDSSLSLRVCRSRYRGCSSRAPQPAPSTLVGNHLTRSCNGSLVTPLTVTSSRPSLPIPLPVRWCPHSRVPSLSAVRVSSPIEGSFGVIPKSREYRRWCLQAPRIRIRRDATAPRQVDAVQLTIQQRCHCARSAASTHPSDVLAVHRLGQSPWPH